MNAGRFLAICVWIGTLLAASPDSDVLTQQQAPAPLPAQAPAPPPVQAPAAPARPVFTDPWMRPPESPDAQRAYEDAVGVVLVGRVVLAGTNSLPEPVPVEYVCPNDRRTEWTDGHGRFRIGLGGQSFSGSMVAGGPPGVRGCKVVLQLPGFEPVVVDLEKRGAKAGLDLGRLELKPKQAAEQMLFSERAAAAPAGARRAYVRALELRSAGSLPEALTELAKALQVDAQYAPALQLRGQIQERMKQREAARASYRAAAQADPKYLKPLVSLAEMAAEDQDPEQTAYWAGRVNRLAPDAFPNLYFAEGASYFNVGRFEEAARVAQAGCAADATHSFPRLQKLLGQALFKLNRYGAAAAAFEEYLRLAAGAADEADVRARAADAERLAKILNR